jgi:hypothetical protein
VVSYIEISEIPSANPNGMVISMAPPLNGMLPMKESKMGHLYGGGRSANTFSGNNGRG